MSAALKVPKKTVASIILKWMKFGISKTFHRAVHPANFAIGGDGPWSGSQPRTWWSLWQSSRVPMWRMENLPEGQPSLLYSTNQAFMLEWPDRSHSSVKRHMTSCLVYAKRHLKDSQTKRNKLLWSDETKIELTSGGNLEPSLRWSMVVAASGCGDAFQWQGLGN